MIGCSRLRGGGGASVAGQERYGGWLEQQKPERLCLEALVLSSRTWEESDPAHGARQGADRFPGIASGLWAGKARRQWLSACIHARHP